MGDLSKNFSRHEWQCKCGECPPPTVDAELVLILQNNVRDYYMRAVTITPNGGHRCDVWNRARGGSVHSQHINGRAADIQVRGVHPREVYAHLATLYRDRFGIGIYRTFVHFDTRAGPAARWRG